MTGSEFDFSEKTSASLQEELQKVLLERHKERLAERCVEQLAQLKEQLAEEQGVDALGEAERMSNKNSGQLQSYSCLTNIKNLGGSLFGVDTYMT